MDRRALDGEGNRRDDRELVCRADLPMMNRRTWLTRVGQAIVAGLASPALLQLAPFEPVHYSLISTAELNAVLKAIYLPEVMRMIHDDHVLFDRLSRLDGA